MARVLQEYPLAQQELDKYPREVRREFGRHTCRLKSLVARAHYLNGRYDQALLVLDSARAYVTGETGSAERAALAVCEMRRAECLMLRANDRLTQQPRWRDDPIGIARTDLDIAASALSRAGGALVREEGNVWNWTMLFLLESQLLHEQWLLSRLAYEAGVESRNEDASRDNWQDAVGTEEQTALVRRALSAIGAGLDNIEKDRVRWKRFKMIWWQFFVCALSDRMGRVMPGSVDEVQSAVDGQWQWWQNENDAAELGWFAALEANELKRIRNKLPEVILDGSMQFTGNRVRRDIIELERRLLACPIS